MLKIGDEVIINPPKELSGGEEYLEKHRGKPGVIIQKGQYAPSCYTVERPDYPLHVMVRAEYLNIKK
jgi:hypothetical protein